MQKRWTILPAKEEEVSALQEALKIHPVLCKLLVQRGIKTYDEAKSYFRPTHEDLHDPFLMQDMAKAVNRIEQAIQNEEKILLFGDYDVDGTTAIALLYTFFKPIYPHLDFYIPDRYEEGYGVSMQGVDWAAANGFSLIIALDCGIKAHQQVDHALGKGIEFIICDHHRPEETLPNAVAVLDPKRPDCHYPYDELSGCGIGFKLTQAYAKQNGIPFEKVLQNLDLLVVSIGSDIVPITGENRVMAYFGLEHINSQPRIGLKVLKHIAGLNKPADITDVVFILGPRINAAGRIDHGRLSVELMIAQNEEKANEYAQLLNQLNDQRKELDDRITEEAWAQVLQLDPNLQQSATVVYQPDWHKGVIGIVASRLIERKHRPTVIFTQSKGEIVGSARSISGFDIYNAIDACSDLLEQFGGHKYAAGLTLKSNNVEAFRERFEQVVCEMIEPHLLIPEIKVDAELTVPDINKKFYNIIRQMGPFGPGNMKPVFLTKAMRDTGSSRILKEQHLKIIAKQNGSGGVEGIGFNLGYLYDEVVKQGPFDLVYSLDENHWNDQVTIQLKIKDLQPIGKR